MNAIVVFALFCLAAGINADTCPSGGEIYAWGISDSGRAAVVKAHNKYRQMIMDGDVPNQPQGKDLKMMHFDENLANEGRKVSETCELNHIIASDDRWDWVGQNLYISWSSAPGADEDWDAAVASWYDEHNNFIYPDGSNGGVTGHYTQLVWADSEFLGCDFIAFYDYDQPSYPYAQLYTCNYGPGGNYEGQAPYERA